MGKDSNKSEIIEIRMSLVEPNRKQPRKYFDEEKIEELADSIKRYGVLEPIIVKKEDGYYSIVAGERRWRAASKAGLKRIPVIIRNVSEREAADIALVENLQREDLNPIEEAIAFRTYCERFRVKETELAETVSKSKSTISHSLRLLQLAPSVREMIADGKLSAGHGKALLQIKDEKKQIAAAEDIVRKKLNVRDTEKLVRETGGRKKQKKRDLDEDYYRKKLEQELTEQVGMKVVIHQEKKKGSVTIEFYDEEGLELIYDNLMRFER